jgi:hypothetical protein
MSGAHRAVQDRTDGGGGTALADPDTTVLPLPLLTHRGVIPAPAAPTPVPAPRFAPARGLGYPDPRSYGGFGPAPAGLGGHHAVDLARPAGPGTDRGPRGPYQQYWVVGTVVAGFALVVLLLIVLLTSLTSTPTMTVSGTARVISTGSTMSSGSACTGRGAYSDMVSGRSVTVYGSNGTVVGTGTLQDGEAQTRPGGSDYYADSCAFTFTVSGVPADQEQYGIRVGGRSVVEYTPAQVKDDPEIWMGR